METDSKQENYGDKIQMQYLEWKKHFRELMTWKDYKDIRMHRLSEIKKNKQVESKP